MAAVPGGTVVWIHGPQPVSFEGEEALLQRIDAPAERAGHPRPAGRRRAERGGRHAQRCSPRCARWRISAIRRWPLARILDARAGRKAFYRFERTRVPRSDIAGDIPEGSSISPVFWAFSEIPARRLIRSRPTKEGRVVVRYRLVTPVSGAVAETAKQYCESGLESRGRRHGPAGRAGAADLDAAPDGRGLGAARAWEEAVRGRSLPHEALPEQAELPPRNGGTGPIPSLRYWCSPSNTTPRAGEGPLCPSMCGPVSAAAGRAEFRPPPEVRESASERSSEAPAGPPAVGEPNCWRR